MKLLEKITNFFSGISLELDHETESQLMDYLLEGVGGLNQINISDLDKNEIIKWKLREFKKFLKYGDGFEKNMITLELYKEWEKKNQRNFDDWCDETNNEMFWFKKHGNEWKKFKEKFEIEVKVLKSKN